jgi:hypothetical protein
MADVLDLQEHEHCHGRVISNPDHVEAPPIRLREFVRTLLGCQAGSQAPQGSRRGHIEECDRIVLSNPRSD